MISKLVGTILKKNTKTRAWWAKLIVCLILSNVFFFLLFGGDQQEASAVTISPYVGLVDIQLSANLLTPFQEGKRVLLIHRKARSRIEGMLKSGSESGVTVAVTEKDALTLLSHADWEVLPYLKDFRFNNIARGESFEIHY